MGKFEELDADLFKGTLDPVKKVLSEAGLEKADVDEVVLVGGSTRIPKIKQLVKGFFNGKEPNTGINPDEAVAYGAAVQGGVLSGKAGEMVLIDVNPLTLGIETVGGVMTKLIPLNSIIPTKKSQVFSTAADNQETVTIKVYEGERAMTKDNHLLGQFDLTGIPPAPRGTAQIDVTFSIDANGILTVSAEEKGTGNKKEITINNEDNKIKEAAAARNELESYAYSLKNTVDDEEKIEAKLDEDEIEEITDAASAAIEWMDNNPDASPEEYKEKKKELEEIAGPLMSKIFGAGQGSRPADEEEEEDHDEL